MLKLTLKILPVCILFILLSCQDKGDSIDVHSSNFSSKKEKIAFLKKHFDLKTKVKDVKYWIFYQDNSKGLVPGPSFSSTQVALKLDKYNFDKWIDTTQGVKEVDPYEQLDWTGILPATSYWNIKGKKRFYDNGFVWVEDNNILLYSHTVN